MPTAGEYPEIHYTSARDARAARAHREDHHEKPTYRIYADRNHARGLIAASPQLGLAQSSPLIGSWKLNLEKSKIVGSPPRSVTLTYQQDGQNIRDTIQGIDAQGNQFAVVLMHIYDGQPHPSTGNPDYDATAYTRVDANTLILARFKAGKLIAVGTIVISPDGKTATNNTTGLGSGPGSGTGIEVFDKQSVIGNT